MIERGGRCCGHGASYRPRSGDCGWDALGLTSSTCSRLGTGQAGSIAGPSSSSRHTCKAVPHAKLKPRELSGGNCPGAPFESGNIDRKSLVKGKSGSVRVVYVGRPFIKKKKDRDLGGTTTIKKRNKRN